MEMAIAQIPEGGRFAAASLLQQSRLVVQLSEWRCRSRRSLKASASRPHPCYY